MKRRMNGFQKRIDPRDYADVRLARISYEDDAAVCSCGWLTRAARAKVREDQVDRHLLKRHRGRGIRL